MKKLLVTLAIVSLIMSCSTAQATNFNPYQEEFDALQEQITQLQSQADGLQGQIDEMGSRDFTDKVMYHKRMHYYMMKPLCPKEVPEELEDVEWFCSNEDRRPNRIDLSYSPWTLVNTFEDVHIGLTGGGVSGMIGYVTAINPTQMFRTIYWDQKIKFTNPVDLYGLRPGESRVYELIITVVPKEGGGYSSAISGRVIARNFRKSN